MERVLIIEDDADIRELERDYLESHKFKVSTADGYTSATSQLMDTPYDCIVMDFNLGNEGGNDIVKFIKENNTANSMTPIIVVSGEIDESCFKEIEEKIFKVLVKPFPQKELVVSILDAIKKVKGIAGKALSFKKMNVLVVDDDIDFGTTVSRFLRENKVNVVYSTGSKDALERLQGQKFDCILLDYKLDHSTHNGDWLVEQIRNDEKSQNQDTPVVMISGFIDEKSTPVDDLIQGVIEKPVSNSVVSQLIVKIVSEKKSSKDVA